MGDSYWRYGAGAGVPERDGVPRASFPGYVSSEASFLSSHHLANDLRGTSSDYLQKDILPLRPGAYGLDTFAGLASHTAPGFSGLISGASLKGFPSPLEDPALSSRGIPELLNERPSSLRKIDNLFRPFIGFKELRLVHKEPRHSRDKAMVLCFVEFSDAKCALTAMEALQGYKFDEKKPDAPILKIQFAQFPFCPPSSRDDQRLGDPR
ncbi:hypothetical protein IFM89_033053 [Coptis chinensis]|uniref:RRM domain-containing protein n=1 Tax=Coptis chinensis TaxID=261450 RepID=A0A835II49_9MAGN|nr:hypothetical protein IFM89_033053 [Coptis chinensis]